MKAFFSVKNYLGAAIVLSAFSAFGVFAQTVVCSNDAIPAGYVKTALTNRPACNSGQGWQIELPYENQLVCRSSPVPSPYVVVPFGDNNTTACGEVRLRIGNARENLQICAGSPIPSGYVITNIDSTPRGCLVGQYYIRQATNGILACGNSPVSPGYVFTWNGQSSVCGNTYGQRRFEIARNGMLVCADSSIPDGYVVTQAYDNNGQTCTFGQRYIQLPTQGIAVCPISPIPAGWRSSGSVSTNSCGNNFPQALILTRN
ncbi:hypothetical protein ACCQ21_16330 [Xanthomonas axonopodis pv. desmodiigangetici]|uniref:hypothetical protein n=1 Tax=Xanthomonas axonopodis TaxID=53413 RepID=UPI00355838CB